MDEQAPRGAAPPPEAPGPKGTLSGALVGLALLGGLSGYYLQLSLRAARAPAAALLNPPPAWVYALGLAAAVGLAVALVVARARKRGPESPVWRLPAVMGFLLVSVHFLLLPPYSVPVHPDELVAGQLAEVGPESLPVLGERFSTDPAALREAFGELPAPYLWAGERIAGWELRVRSGCEGPWLELPADVRVATWLFCFSGDGRKAWVTAVGLGGETFGRPALVTLRGKPAAAVVDLTAAPAPAAPEAGSPPGEPDGAGAEAVP